MLPRPHFLIATDMAPEFRPHLAFAVRLADSLQAHVTLFHAVQSPAPLLGGAPLLPEPPLVDTTEPAHQALRELADSLKVARPLHVAVSPAGDCATAVLAAAAATMSDVVVLPTHARTGVARLLLGSVAETVLRHSRKPVVLLTAAMISQRPVRVGGKARPVVVTTDASPMAAGAFAQATDLARRLELPVVLFAVVPQGEGPPLGGGLPLAVPTIDPRIRLQERQTALRKEAAAFGSDVQIETQAVIHDDAAAAICKVAEDLDAAFVVMATHGRTGLARTLLGSVTEAVVHRSRVPVVCVPTRA
jgi:nucleotide-binding universal stress UspA family protein